jgi:hypothetical protein
VASDNSSVPLLLPGPPTDQKMRIVVGTRQEAPAPSVERMDAPGLTRAEFLRASVGGMLLSTGTAAAEQTLSDPAIGAYAMLTRPIPSTGEAMPVIGLGTWQASDVGTDPAARRPLRDVLELLLDSGGRTIDSSPMYGRAEAVIAALGPAVAHRRHRPDANTQSVAGEGVPEIFPERADPLIRVQSLHRVGPARSTRRRYASRTSGRNRASSTQRSGVRRRWRRTSYQKASCGDAAVALPALLPPCVIDMAKSLGRSRARFANAAASPNRCTAPPSLIAPQTPAAQLFDRPPHHRSMLP